MVSLTIISRPIGKDQRIEGKNSKKGGSAFMWRSRKGVVGAMGGRVRRGRVREIESPGDGKN